jgi:hypothetical protein
MDMNRLAEESVDVSELGRIAIFRRLRKARVVLGMDASGTFRAVRGTKIWADILAGRADEFDAETIFTVRTPCEGDHLFLLVASALSRW